MTEEQFTKARTLSREIGLLKQEIDQASYLLNEQLSQGSIKISGMVTGGAFSVDLSQIDLTKETLANYIVRAEPRLKRLQQQFDEL